MSESLRMWVEISFNLAYLIVVYGFVIAMKRRQPQVPPDDQPLTRLFIWSFALLALGDTGHVGFRVLAYALGDLETTFSLFGLQLGLVGLGALSTAITVTLFYIVILMMWRERFDKPYGWFGILLFAAAFVRFLIMLSPQNQWNSTVPPQPQSLYRNIPLTVLGLGVAYLILQDAFESKDRTFIWVGSMIVVWYAFYIPVILLVQLYPIVGMLMIPKTLAYVAIAIIAYFNLFQVPSRSTMAVKSPSAQRTQCQIQLVALFNYLEKYNLPGTDCYEKV